MNEIRKSQYLNFILQGIGGIIGVLGNVCNFAVCEVMMLIPKLENITKNVSLV